MNETNKLPVERRSIPNGPHNSDKPRPGETVVSLGDAANAIVSKLVRGIDGRRNS
jgi:hypothetical protein